MIGWYKRVDAALAAAVVEMYVEGVSTRKVERVAERLGVSSISRSEVSRLARELDEGVAAFRGRSLKDQRYCYLWLDATFVRCRVDRRSVSQALVVAVGLGEDGYKHVLGADAFDTESRDGWEQFIGSLRERGLSGVRLVVSDAHCGLGEAIRACLQGASWQRCYTHLMRDVLGKARNRAERARLSPLLRVPIAQRDPLLARCCYERAAEEVSRINGRCGECFAAAEDDALAYTAFPVSHWNRIRTSNVIERENREIKRRTTEIGSFPSRESMLRLACSVLMESDDSWQARHLFEPENAGRAWSAGATRPPTPEGVVAARARADALVQAALDRPSE